ncbi:MAG: ATP-binding cassette domain-containing protein [Acetatifactor sp.]|nr:ATP-binding cassette domain-containing protein [Acetatifactor sp.]
MKRTPHSSEEASPKRTSTIKNKTFILIIWLLLWQVTAMIVHNDILLASPVKTVVTLWEYLLTADFYISLSGSIIRIILGIITGFLLAVIMSIIAVRFKAAKEFFAPLVGVFKSVPVAVFVVLMIIWWGTDLLTLAVCIPVALPNMYINILEGMKTVDKKMLEVAHIYHFSPLTSYRFIYKEAVKDNVYSAAKISVGMCFKAGIAAEIIGTPKYSIGGRLYLSKIYLDTPGVFAWAVAIIIISFLAEKLFIKLLDIYFYPRTGKITFTEKKTSPEASAVLRNVSKSFGDEEVLKNVNMELFSGNIYFLNDPSGSGKTTTLRILSELEKPDRGSVNAPEAAFCFQEDRLFEDHDAITNIMLGGCDRKRAHELALTLLGTEDIQKPVRDLSGGQKRRVSLLRAFAGDFPMILLDEPFTGLDEENRKKASDFIEGNKDNRIIVIASHVKA